MGESGKVEGMKACFWNIKAQPFRQFLQVPAGMGLVCSFSLEP